MRDLFEDWFTNYFCPVTELYCNQNDIEFKILFLIDNAPGHPPELGDLNHNVKQIFTTKHDFITTANGPRNNCDFQGLLYKTHFFSSY